MAYMMHAARWTTKSGKSWPYNEFEQGGSLPDDVFEAARLEPVMDHVNEVVITVDANDVVWETQATKD